MDITVCLDIAEIAGGGIVSSGTRFLIVDKYKCRNSLYVVLNHAPSGDRLLKIISGILNLDDSIVLLLGSADPRDCETEFRSFLVVRYGSDSAVEIVEKELLPRIKDVSEEAIRAVDRKDQQARIEAVLGALREVEP